MYRFLCFCFLWCMVVVDKCYVMVKISQFIHFLISRLFNGSHVDIVSQCSDSGVYRYQLAAFFPFLLLASQPRFSHANHIVVVVEHESTAKLMIWDIDVGSSVAYDGILYYSLCSIFSLFVAFLHTMLVVWSWKFDFNTRSSKRNIDDAGDEWNETFCYD